MICLGCPNEVTDPDRDICEDCLALARYWVDRFAEVELERLRASQTPHRPSMPRRRKVGVR